MSPTLPVSAAFPRLAYTISAHQLQQLPAESLVEIAIAGRSNAGKSSAINTVCGHQGLAKTSKLPGRTQQLVAFTAADGRSLVDLPGYGFAQVTKQLRQHWQGLIAGYLKRRRTLAGIVVVMDSRRPMLALDVEFLEQCAAAGRRIHVLLSKSDKLSRSEAKLTLRRTEKTLDEQFRGTTVQLFSSLSGDGVELARSILLEWWQEGGPRLEK
ncbi:MAG: YihA family ribosome biogenesis GTP-binding protein [Gammaproteobacteria bacterium]|nr:YihA family ribosome biogenesis GTP-binding protein [Gammaproteobacteria bacterium]